MGKKSRQLSFSFLVAILIFAFAGSAAHAGPATQQLATGDPQAEPQAPKVSGYGLVWVNSGSGNQNIYWMNLLNESAIPVSANSDEQWNPNIDGSRVVWTDNRTNDLGVPVQSIYLKDMTTGAEQRVSLGTYLSPDFPAVSGSRVFWQARDWLTPAFTHIYYRDLSEAGDQEQMLEGKVMDQVHPVASGNRVAWTDETATTTHVEVYDFATGQAQLVTNSYSNQSSPSLDGDIIAWQDDRNGSPDIYLKNLASGLEESVATGPASQQSPAVAGALVAWLEDGNVIKLNNLSSGITVTLANDPSRKTDLVMSKAGWLVWQDSRSGSPALYAINLAAGKPNLGLAVSGSCWASYSDYELGRLSVDFQVTNSSAGGAYGARITSVTATNGVTVKTPMPLDIGDIAPASTVVFTIVYQMPVGVSRFSTSLAASCLDGAANVYTYP